MIKQIKKIYLFNDLKNAGYDYYLFLNGTLQSATNTLNISIDIPNYILDNQYMIKYLIVLIDNTAIARDYPRYRFSTSSSTSNTDRFSINTPTTSNSINSNAIYGISQYCFYNNG